MSSDDPYATAAASRSGMRTAILLALLAFVLGIAVTVVFVQQYRNWLPGNPKTLADAGTATTAGEANPNGAGFEPPPEAGAAARSVDADAIDARQAALAAQLAVLEARSTMIDQESRAAAGNAGRAEALLVAFAARRAIDRGLALGSVEPQLRARFGTTQPRAVASILQASRTPVTVEDLRLALDAIGPELTTGIATDGWWTSLRRELSSLIVIRHEGTPSPRAADRLARVRRLLDARQVEAALAEVARLPGAAQAASWMAAAGRYVQAHAALDAIETAAIVGQGADMTTAAAAPTTAPRPTAAPTLAPTSSGPAAPQETTATAALTP